GHLGAAVALDESGAVLADEARVELRRHTELVEDDERHRKERLAQMKARKRLLFEHDRANARLRELARYRGTARTPSNDDDVMPPRGHDAGSVGRLRWRAELDALADVRTDQREQDAD